MTEGFDIVAVGGATVDIVLTVDRLPSHDEKIMSQLVGDLPGGPAGNFACAASRLGLCVASLSNVGDDERGRLVIEDFERHGVDTSLIQVLAGERTNFTVNMIDPSGEKAILLVPLTPENYSLQCAETVLRTARLMFIMPNDPDQFLDLSALAHECGAEVMIDVEATVAADPAALQRLLAGTDIASFNRMGFTRATGDSPSIEAARNLLQYGPHTVVVTLGADGALAVTRDDAAQRPGYRVKVVDSTGAGDVFNAAFARATLESRPLEERLRFATAAGALAVTEYGPRGRLPTKGEISSLIDSENGENNQ